MTIFPRQAPIVIEETQPKKLYEVEVIYGKDDSEIHLVLAYSEPDAMVKLNRQWKPVKSVLGFRFHECTRYASVILGSRRLI